MSLSNASELRKLRRVRFLSIEALARVVGLTQPQLSFVELGQRAARPDIQAALAAYFKVPQSALFGADGYAL
ncbi:MAG: helix-turn-helix domain-containing protein [Synergistaceae bacterium]|nr:helix-turn-helix domain-containing protein [Synergistaceae bacterium]